MKGLLALDIVLGLACIWRNTDGMRVNVKVNINPKGYGTGEGDNPNNSSCFDTTCTKSGKKCMSTSYLPETLPETLPQSLHLSEEDFQALRQNITSGCSSGSPDSFCVCVDIKTADKMEASTQAHPPGYDDPCANRCTWIQWIVMWWACMIIEHDCAVG